MITESSFYADNGVLDVLNNFTDYTYFTTVNNYTQFQQGQIKNTTNQTLEVNLFLMARTNYEWRTYCSNLGLTKL